MFIDPNTMAGTSVDTYFVFRDDGIIVEAENCKLTIDHGITEYTNLFGDVKEFHRDQLSFTVTPTEKVIARNIPLNISEDDLMNIIGGNSKNG